MHGNVSSSKLGSWLILYTDGEPSSTHLPPGLVVKVTVGSRWNGHFHYVAHNHGDHKLTCGVGQHRHLELPCGSVPHAGRQWKSHLPGVVQLEGAHCTGTPSAGGVRYKKSGLNL